MMPRNYSAALLCKYQPLQYQNFRPELLRHGLALTIRVDAEVREHLSCHDRWTESAAKGKERLGRLSHV